MKLSQALTVALLATSTLALSNVASADTLLHKEQSSMSMLTTHDLRLAVDAGFAGKILKHQPSPGYDDEFDKSYTIAHRASVGAFTFKAHAHYFFYKNPSISLGGGVDVGYATGSGSVAADNYVTTVNEAAINQSLSYQDFQYGISLFSQFNTDTYFTPFVKVNVGRLHTNFNDFKEKGWYYGGSIGASVHNGFFARFDLELGRVKDKAIVNRLSDKYTNIGLAVGYSF